MAFTVYIYIYMYIGRVGAQLIGQLVYNCNVGCVYRGGQSTMEVNLQLNGFTEGLFAGCNHHRHKLWGDSWRLISDSKPPSNPSNTVTVIHPNNTMSGHIHPTIRYQSVSFLHENVPEFDLNFRFFLFFTSYDFHVPECLRRGFD